MTPPIPCHWSPMVRGTSGPLAIDLRVAYSSRIHFDKPRRICSEQIIIQENSMQHFLRKLSDYAIIYHNML